jgi:hypothetical protein
MARALRVFAAGLVAAIPLAACSVLVDTTNLSGPANEGATSADGGSDGAGATDSSSKVVISAGITFVPVKVQSAKVFIDNVVCATAP